MAQQTCPQALHSLKNFALKTPCPILPSLLKIKTLAQADIYRHICHVVRAVANAKSMVMDLLSKKIATTNYNMKLRRKKKKLFSSIRMCCSWSSSHVIPMPEPGSMEGFDSSHAYYDSTWNSIISTANEVNEDMEPPLSGYLQWLEENGSVTDDGATEIDRLAEKFIERCHEKFRLEKQESYRRYQEMLARSM